MASTDAGLKSPQKEGRLLLISNRLPITIKRTDEKKYETSMSSGGLVSGLSGLAKTTTFQWYGWPGIQVPEDEIDFVKKKLKDEYNAVPVFLADDLADKHYNGFSSKYSLRQSAPQTLTNCCRLDSVATVSLSSWRNHL
jgi:trehalose 6-phosphate synthase